MNSQEPTPKPGGAKDERVRTGKPCDIRERTFKFALRILEITSSLPGTPEAGIVRNQLSASGTSIGANVEEADGAVSKADKRKALVIARKETRETRYWLRIISCKWRGVASVEGDVSEATELLYILSAMISKLS